MNLPGHLHDLCCRPAARGRALGRCVLAAVCGVLVLWPAAQTLAAEPAAAAGPREQLRHQRAAVEARAKKDEAACSDRFAVSSCVNDVHRQRREALAKLRAEEIALDEAKRKAEVQENTRRLEAKRAEALVRPPPAPHAEPAARASAPAPTAQAASAAAERQRRMSKTADDAAAAAQRVVAQQGRASEAAAHREAVEQRNAQRVERGKKSTSLPVPAALPPASAASR
jgi:colicin import membrane protein